MHGVELAVTLALIAAPVYSICSSQMTGCKMALEDVVGKGPFHCFIPVASCRIIA